MISVYLFLCALDRNINLMASCYCRRIAQGMQIAGKPTEGKLAHPITLLRIAYGLKE